MRRRFWQGWLIRGVCAVLCFTAGGAGWGAEPPEEIVLREFLVMAPPGKYGREPLHRDPIDAAMARGTWTAPTREATLTDAEGEIHRWYKADAGSDGALKHTALLGGGYAYATVDSPAARTMILEAKGHAFVYVNGAPRPGDPYQNGWLHLPVELRAGKNELLFHVSAGGLTAKLAAPRKPLAFDTADNTLPDVLEGVDQKLWGAVLLVNAATEPTGELTLITTRPGGEPRRTPLSGVPPCSVRKAAFQIAGGADSAGDRTAPVKVQVVRSTDGKDQVLDEIELKLRVRRPGESHVRTFVSRIDGSVQYYAVQPAAPGVNVKPGVILSLHGASVQAVTQAEQYRPKPWAHVVAPTNRRPYGFDWEDWGRIDALEVLDEAQRQLANDPKRVYVTGHSMGGHGSWHLGSTYPDRFAAVGPSAGWCSFWTYGRMPRPNTSQPIPELLARGTSVSDPLRVLRNLAQPGVYVLHGQDDDDVPVAQARLMRGQLALFHPNFAYYERPKAGHRWGAECCDWPPMMEFFERQTLPAREEVDQVDFLTASPGVSNQCHWLSIEAQRKQFQPSRATLKLHRDERRFVGQTENVERLALDVASLPPNRPIHLELDGQKIETIAWPADTQRLWLAKDGKKWRLSVRPSPKRKGPQRYGAFKSAFDHQVLFVYGTRGTPEENAWALNKARFDAETFYYRGNASVDVVADHVFDPKSQPDRSVIVYGNAETNAAWPALLAGSPVQVRRGAVRIGSRPETGDDLACLFVQPRPGSETALVGVVSGSGVAGMRATDRLRYFLSGVAYPDLLLYSTDALTRGVGEVRAAGYFDLDWSLDDAEIAWRDLAL